MLGTESLATSEIPMLLHTALSRNLDYVGGPKPQITRNDVMRNFRKGDFLISDGGW